MCFCFKYFINLSGHLILVRLQKAQEAGLPIPATMCSILLCIYAMAWLPVFAALCCVSIYTMVWLPVFAALCCVSLYTVVWLPVFAALCVSIYSGVAASVMCVSIYSGVAASVMCVQ